MTDESHSDPEHHTHGVRGRIVEAPNCGSGYTGSNPVACPISYRFTELDDERFTVVEENPDTVIDVQVKRVDIETQKTYGD